MNCRFGEKPPHPLALLVTTKNIHFEEQALVMCQKNKAGSQTRQVGQKGRQGDKAVWPASLVLGLLALICVFY
jgi:hypothetical protein